MEVGVTGLETRELLFSKTRSVREDLSNRVIDEDTPK